MTSSPASRIFVSTTRASPASITQVSSMLALPSRYGKQQCYIPTFCLKSREDCCCTPLASRVRSCPPDFTRTRVVYTASTQLKNGVRLILRYLCSKYHQRPMITKSMGIVTLARCGCCAHATRWSHTHVAATGQPPSIYISVFEQLTTCISDITHSTVVNDISSSDFPD